ncbi:cyclophilin-like fold protein [Priestia filamentosa]|nr:cyclophilin-like fold protein [Priestia filamentosa]
MSYPSNKLSTEEAPAGTDPTIGDFTYYAPWGNLAIFYKDSGYSNRLIKLGEIESGIEKLENLNGDFTMIIERID